MILFTVIFENLPSWSILWRRGKSFSQPSLTAAADGCTSLEEGRSDFHQVSGKLRAKEKKKKWRLHLKSQEMLVGLRQWVSSFKDFRGRIIPNAFKLRKGSSLLEELTEEEYGQHWKRGEKRCEVRVER